MCRHLASRDTVMSAYFPLFSLEIHNAARNSYEVRTAYQLSSHDRLNWHKLTSTTAVDNWSQNTKLQVHNACMFLCSACLRMCSLTGFCERVPLPAGTKHSRGIPSVT